MDIGDLTLRLTSCEVRDRMRTSNQYHSHPCDEWHFVLSGRAVFMHDGEALRVTAGDFWYTEPRTRHLMATPEADAALVQYILWSERCSRALRRLLRERLPPGRVLHLGLAQRPFFRRLDDLLARADDPLAAQAAAQLFLGFLLDRLAGDGPATTLPAAVRAMREWVEGHLDRALSVEELARVAGCDRSHASRLFRRHCGMAPSAFVLDCKMRRACELLRTGDQDVALVAEQVGYADPFHFSRAFKRWSGRSPSAWRAARE